MFAYLGDDAPLSTGIEALDCALGGGVYPGETVIISGPEAGGKTLLALRLAARALADGGECAWIDADAALDPAFALGVSPTCARLLAAAPPDPLAALDMLCRLAAGGPRLIALDSLTGLLGPGETHNDDDVPDLPSELDRRLSVALHRALPALRRSGTILALTRQTPPWAGRIDAPSSAYHHLRRRLNALAPGLLADAVIHLEAAEPFQAEPSSPGLRLRARVSRPGLRRQDDYSIKIAPCSQRIEFDIMYKQGFIRTGEMV